MRRVMVLAFLVAMSWSPEPRAEAKNETLALLCHRFLDLAPTQASPKTQTDRLQELLDEQGGSLKSPGVRRLLVSGIADIARTEARTFAMQLVCENWRGIIPWPASQLRDR